MLQSTVLYPQGGGQGSDTGLIERVDANGTSIVFKVQEVKSSKAGGVVLHYGSWANPTQTFAEVLVVEALTEQHKVVITDTHVRGGLSSSVVGNASACITEVTQHVCKAANRDRLIYELPFQLWHCLQGTRVHMHVDEERRRLHARIHSAGHLLDAAMRNIGRGEMEPAKGQHTLEQAYVEYKVGNNKTTTTTVAS